MKYGLVEFNLFHFLLLPCEEWRFTIFVFLEN